VLLPRATSPPSLPHVLTSTLCFSRAMRSLSQNSSGSTPAWAFLADLQRNAFRCSQSIPPMSNDPSAQSWVVYQAKNKTDTTLPSRVVPHPLLPSNFHRHPRLLPLRQRIRILIQYTSRNVMDETFLSMRRRWRNVHSDPESLARWSKAIPVTASTIPDRRRMSWLLVLA
jgi:hypothetical protein